MTSRRKLTKSERRQVYDKCAGHCAYCGCELDDWNNQKGREKEKMSDDLISRKSLIEHLNQFAPEYYNALVNDLIKKEPAAFDKEKVIGELKSEIELCVTHPLYPGRYIKKSRAIEIVEKGGME